MRILWLIMALVLIQCKDKIDTDVFAYLLTPDGFLNPVELEDDPDPNPKKYTLTWKNPTNQREFQGNRIYLDTNDWSTVVRDHKKAHGPVLWMPVEKDEKGAVIHKESQTIIFSFGNLTTKEVIEHTDNYNNTGFPYFIFDTSGYFGEDRKNKDFKLNFALVSVHDGTIGQPRFAHIVVDDRFPPYPLRPKVEVKAKEFLIGWTRPRDQTSFFNSDPDLDTGLIVGYHILLKSRRQVEDENYKPLDIESIQYIVNDDTNRTDDTSWSFKPFGDNENIRVDILESGGDSGKVDIFLADNKRYNGQPVSISARIFGLEPLQKYEYQVFAEDSNQNLATKVAEVSTINTTDTSPPDSIKDFEVIYKDNNQISLTWTPSKDTRPGDDSLDQNIKSYRILKIIRQDSLILGSGDTLSLLVNVGSKSDSVKDFNQSKVTFPTDSTKKYSVSFFFLPPGQWYSFVISAEDSTGHLSPQTEVRDSTTDISSSIDCPEGYIAINNGSSPFCIEAYEHQDSAGNFMTRVTLDEAAEICAEQEGSYLCSESEWNRACQGSGGFNPYGIQSISTDSSLAGISASLSILQTTCNQGADDKEMAFDISLRNDVCSTNEGVFDMSGNLSEWIATDSSSATVRFKGGNFLKPPISTAALQAKALCSHAPYTPRLQRPDYRCLSEVPNYTVVYKEAVTGKNSNIICSDLSNHPEGVSTITVLDSIKVDGQWVQKDSSMIRVNYLDGEQSNLDLIYPGTKDTIPPEIVSFNKKNLVELIYIPADEYNYADFFHSSGDLDTAAFNEVSGLNPHKYIRDTIEIFNYQASEESAGDHIHDSTDFKIVEQKLEIDSLLIAELDSLIDADTTLKIIYDSLLTVYRDSLDSLIKDTALLVRNDSIMMILNDSLQSLVLKADSILKNGGDSGITVQLDSLNLVMNDSVLGIIHGSVFLYLDDSTLTVLDDSLNFNSDDSLHMLIYNVDSLMSIQKTTDPRIEVSLETLDNTLKEVEVLNQARVELLKLLDQAHDHGSFEFSTANLNFNQQPSQNPLLTRELNENWKVIPVKAMYGYIITKKAELGKDPVPTFKPAKRFFNFEAIGFRCCSEALP